MAVKKYKGRPYHLWNPFTDVEALVPMLGLGPVTIVRGEGPYVFNERGDRFLNGLSGLWNVAVGFSRPELVEAARKQMETLPYATCFNLSHPRAVELAEKLVKVTGNHYSRVYLGSNGSEAVETAVKMARQYQKQGPEKGKYKIISVKHSYHGTSYAAMSTSGAGPPEDKFGPLVPGFVQIEPPYCYRCPYGLSHPKCEMACARQLEKAIKKEGPDTVAAFIMEPVMGSYGIIPPPEEYYGIVGRICRKYDVLLVADEVSTGFGRTGKLFVSADWDPGPDILCLGKAVSSGYFPVSATLATEAVYERFVGKGKSFQQGCTHSGHPVGAAVALRNIDIIIDEDLPGNAKKVGKYLKTGLEGLKKKHGHIGDVRGRGLMLGVEMVKDRKTREPFSDGAMDEFIVDMALRGVLMYHEGPTISLMPPLIIKKKHADEIIKVMDAALQTGVGSTISKKGRLVKEFVSAKFKGR